MKKRILSFVLVLSMLLPIISITAFSAEDIKSDKQYMEQYICNLTDGGDYMKYTNHPFDEYNNLVSRKVYDADMDMLVAIGDLMNNAENLLSWVIKNGFVNTNSYSEAKYEALCAEWLTKVTNKSVNEELAANIGNIDELEGKNRKFDEILIEFADVLAKKSETTTAYNRLHESFIGDKELINAVGESKFIKGFPVITSLFSVLIRDYEENEKYLDIMKNVVYETALSHEELANSIKDKNRAESMRKEAQSMRNAVDKVVRKYKDRASGAFNELTNLIIQYGTKEKFDELKTIIGKETFKGVFKLFDLTTFGIELFMNISGLGDIAKGSANTIFMFPITLNIQNKFFEEGKLCLSDGDFSDEDYEHMNLLFDLCRAAQEINCEYADVNFDKSAKTNEQIIQEYVNYAMSGGKKEFRYEIIEQAMTWEEAKDYCESLGGHLVSITSREEQAVIVDLLRKKGKKNTECYMIGVHENIDNFSTWITGEIVEYQNWATMPSGVWDFYGGPIGGISAKEGSFLFVGTFGDWCQFKDKKYPFICEYDDVELPMTETEDTDYSNDDSYYDDNDYSDDGSYGDTNSSNNDSYNDYEIPVISAFYCHEYSTLNLDGIEHKGYVGTNGQYFTVNRDKVESLTFHSFASDNIGLKKLELVFDGVPIKTSYSTSLAATIQTSALRVGETHQIYIIATDTSGNESSSYIWIETTGNSENGSFSPTPQQGEVSVKVDGNYINFDVPPQIINNRTMIPVRAVTEALGAEVSWSPESEIIRIEKDLVEIFLEIGSTDMVVMRSKAEPYFKRFYIIDQPPVIVNNRTLVPIRMICEELNYFVDWDDSTKTVSIYK